MAMYKEKALQMTEKASQTTPCRRDIRSRSSQTREDFTKLQRIETQIKTPKHQAISKSCMQCDPYRTVNGKNPREAHILDTFDGHCLKIGL